MARTSKRTAAAEEAALIGRFILWAGAIQDVEGVVLVGPAHKAAIDAAARRLFRLVREESRARTTRKEHRHDL